MSEGHLDNQRRHANRKRRVDAQNDLPPMKRIKSYFCGHIRMEDICKSHGPTNNEQKQSINPFTLAEHKPSYDPGVDCSQSHYFHSNKLLFELNLERLQRSGQQ